MQKDFFVDLSLFSLKRLIYFLQINFIYIIGVIIVYLLITNKSNQTMKHLLFYIALFAIGVFFRLNGYQSDNK